MIQSLRKSRFLFLRSRYAYFQPRSTVSLAGRHSLLRAPKAPRAAFMICFFRLTQAAFPLRGLLGQDVALERLVAAHFAGPGDLEALRRALVGFHFWHIS